MAGATIYPPASGVQWYGDGNVTVTPTAVLWHTTETAGGWPGYANGANAPNLTYEPWRHQWRQHFPVNDSARALRNGPNYRTNRMGVCQVEVATYCDPARMGPKHVSRLDRQAYDDMGAFAAWMYREWGVPLDADRVGWLAYPDSYGDNGVRLSENRFRTFAGHCAHMHAPHNTHGDVGEMDVRRIVAAATGQRPLLPPPEEDDMKPKIFTLLGPDPKTGSDDALVLFVPPFTRIGLNGKKLEGGQTGATDVEIASRYCDFANKPEDGALYATQAADIATLLARGGL